MIHNNQPPPPCAAVLVYVVVACSGHAAQTDGKGTTVHSFRSADQGWKEHVCQMECSEAHVVVAMSYLYNFVKDNKSQCSAGWHQGTHPI